MTRLAALIALCPLFTLACAFGHGNGSGSSSNGATAACAQFSSLGESVLAGANSAPSTISQVGWGYNTVASGPIIGGQAFAAAATQVITAARQEVIIESFIIADTWITGQVRDAIAKIDPSIPVYVLFTTDSVSTINFQFDQTMADNVLKLLDPNHTHNVIVANWDGRIDINHDKSIIVDRETLLVSNINMEPSADPTWASSTGNDWYQMGVILRGDIAGAAASEATSAWTHAGAFASSRSDAETNAIPTRTAPGGSGCTPMIALGREVSAGEDSSADKGFVSLFTSAQKELHVQTPNLNDDGALAALVQATNNVDVYVVLSKGFTGWTEDIPGEGGSNVDVVEDRLPGMLQSSGNASRMHVRWYASSDNPGVAVDGTAVNGASHAKFASADSQVMVLGSQNMDTQSWKVSREFSVAIDDSSTTGTFDAAFWSVWQRSACAFESAGCNASDGGTGEGGSTETDGGVSGEGGGSTGDGGAGYAFVERRPERHHPVSLANGATEVVPFSWNEAAGLAPPADLWIASSGRPVLQVTSVGSRPFVRAGFDVVSLTAGAAYTLELTRHGDDLGVTVRDSSRHALVTTEIPGEGADVVLPSAPSRSAIVSPAL